MPQTRARHALARAQLRGYLVLSEAPTDPPSSPEIRWLQEQWNAHCETLSLHRIVVCPGFRSRWCVMIVFRNGPDAELGYIKHAFVGAFQRHLGRGPSRGDPEAWVGRTSKREAAEAVA